MNRRRVAALLRQLAELGQELAAELEADAPANDAAPRRRRPLPPPAPTRPPTELDRRRALQELQRLGHRVKP